MYKFNERRREKESRLSVFNSDFFKFHLFENFSERCLEEEKNVKEKKEITGSTNFRSS